MANLTSSVSYAVSTTLWYYSIETASYIVALIFLVSYVLVSVHRGLSPKITQGVPLLVSGILIVRTTFALVQIMRGQHVNQQIDFSQHAFFIGFVVLAWLAIERISTSFKRNVDDG